MMITATEKKKKKIEHSVYNYGQHSGRTWCRVVFFLQEIIIPSANQNKGPKNPNELEKLILAVMKTTRSEITRQSSPSIVTKWKMYLDVNYFQFELARKFELTEVEWAISTVKTYPKEELRIKQKMLPQRTFFVLWWLWQISQTEEHLHLVNLWCVAKLISRCVIVTHRLCFFTHIGVFSWTVK